MMDFTVVPPSRSNPSPVSGGVLQQDNWNDYSFQTLYHLNVFTSEFSGLIGPVKICAEAKRQPIPSSWHGPA